MRLKVAGVLIIVALLTIGYGSAALTAISLDRSVGAGTVLVDTDSNVAVKFSALGTYTGFITETNGKVSFNLAKAIKNGVAGAGYNTEAQFTVGNGTTPVFQVTNNSDVAIKVTMAAGAVGLSLYDDADAAAGTTSIAPGASDSFYFKIDTAGKIPTTALTGTLHVGL